MHNRDGNSDGISIALRSNSFNIGTANQGGNPIINVMYGGGGIRSTSEAFDIYYHGNGSKQAIAGNVITDLLTNKTFQAKNNRIISGKTTSMKGDFSVDLTYTDVFVGHTNVDYSIQVVGANIVVTYTMFVNDGFWDPNIIGEHFQQNPGNRYVPDGMGPNLEFRGGHPYPFIPVIGTEIVPNPGYH